MKYFSQWDEPVGNEACGPTTVQMAISDSGIYPKCAELVALSDPEHNGTTAGDLQALFAHYGVQSYYYWGKALPPAPAILLFRYGALSRVDVQDKQFVGLHWFVFLGVDGDYAIFNDPDWGLWGLRRREGENKRYKLSEIVTGFTGEAITWENKVSTIPTKGTVKSDIETTPKYINVRDGANAPTIIARLADKAVVSIIGSAMDTRTPPRLWYNVSFPLSNPALFKDEALTTPLTQTLTGWCASWLIDTGSTPVPTFSIAVAPATIQAGQSAVLSMNFQNVGGAWLNGSALDGSKLPIIKTVNPVDTTTYTLKVKVGAGFMEKSVTLTVTPTPPPVIGTAKIGFHTLSSDNSNAINAGFRFGMVMNGKENVARMVGVGGVSMFRRYFTYKPDVETMAQDLASLPDGSIGTGFNEWEQMDGGTPAGILAGAAWQIAVATRLRQLNPKVRFAAGTFSTGCPDYTNPAICAAIQQGYAAAYNSGLIWWDQHLYSPTMDWIFKQMPSGLMAMQRTIESMKVGRDQHVATFENYYPVAYGGDIKAAAFADFPTYQWWFELRWLFLFTRCGFDINSPSRIVSGECGVDEGGKGGFVGHGATDQQVVAYFQRFLQLQRAPVVLGGKSYPSPFGGAAIFQLNDTSNDQGHWGSYDMTRYLLAMKAANLFA